MTPLKLYKEFQQVLGSYHISEEGIRALKNLNLVLLVAPTSTGRNTVIRFLTASGGYHYVISDTTRSPRVNDGVIEQTGKEYWFRSEEEMLEDLKKGEFLEAELIHEQQVSGISIRELQRAQKKGKIAITDIDLKGIHNVIVAKPDTIAIMLLPPSFEEWQRRITRRGAMNEAEYARRADTALKIFSDGIENDYYQYVIAENVEQSAAIINSLTTGGLNPHQQRGQDLVRRLQADLKDSLANS